MKGLKTTLSQITLVSDKAGSIYAGVEWQGGMHGAECSVEMVHRGLPGKKMVTQGSQSAQEAHSKLLFDNTKHRLSWDIVSEPVLSEI